VYSHFSAAGRNAPNQDSILPPQSWDGVIWAAIADGVGGARGGAIASQLAIQTVEKLAKEQGDLKAIFQEARNAIVAAANPEHAKMATTLSVCRISGGVCDVAHVGDTRVYHLRGFGIQTRTKDQTEAQELVEAGVLRAGEVRRYPRRHVLTSSIAAQRSFNLFHSAFEVQPGDKILLTSDGVHGLIQRRELRDMAVRADTPEQLSRMIQAEVRERGPIDDYSVAIIYL
jgi:PPM family protein phosphatase